MRLLRVLISIAVLHAAGAVAADVIDASLRITWQGNVGVDGGIPNYAAGTTLTEIDNTGVVDVTADINSALSAAANDTAVVLPAGTFFVDGQINIPTRKVLRGSGIGVTNLITDTSHAIRMYAYQAWTTTDRTVTADINKGATQFTLSSAPTETINVGMKVKLYESNDATDVQAGIEGTTGKGKCQWVQVTAVNGGNTYTFTPPAYTNYRTANTASVTFTWIGSTPTENFRSMAGLESMTVTNTNSLATSIVQFGFATNCWMKDVKTIDCGVSHVAPWDSFRCEMRNCWITGCLPTHTSSRNYGVQCGTPNSPRPPSATSGFLMEGCIVEDVRGGVVLGYGAAGCVIGYNYFVDTFDEAAHIQKPCVIFHSAFPTQNLVEGNFMTRVLADNFHGNGYYNHIVRNWIKGADFAQSKTSALTSIELDYGHRYYSAAGNVLGYSGITAYVSGLGSPGTSVYENYVPNAASSFSNAYRAFMLGYYGEGGGMTTTDTEVRNTLIRKGNYNYVDAAIPAGEALGADTISTSYYHATPPHVVDPTDPSMTDTDLPAGNWYINGTPPAESSVRPRTPGKARRNVLLR